MDHSRKRDIRTIIEKRITELEGILASTSEREDTQRGQLSDEATRIDALTNLSVDSALMARTRDDLNQLRRQLKRIDHKGFGLCRRCGEAIAANRIASVPATDLCIACAQEQEKQA